MAKRRMFSPDVVGSDAFVDMPMSAQALYFHMCLNADDDGFIARPKQICRMVGANEDDLKILIAKRFLLVFSSSVAVIKHWLIHNVIRADLYVETTYKSEKLTLGLNEYGAYTELRDGVTALRHIEEPEWLKRRRGDKKTTGVEPQSEHLRTADVPQTVHNRLVGKVRLGKVTTNTYVDQNVKTERQKSEQALFYILVKKLGYNETTRFTESRKLRLRNRMKTYTPKELAIAADALGNDAYMQGDNDSSKRYGNIDYLLRSDEIIEKYLMDESVIPGEKIDVSKYI
jgi:hypothetical protein